MKHLHLGPGLALPPEAVTQTFAILAKRGVGKTYCALVMAEELLEASAQIVIADPVGVCWGLRAAANGKDPGLPIIVMGGDHGDVPLEATAGKVVAEFVVDSRQSVILDLSLLRKGDQVRFMTDFAETLYHRNRAPLHLVLDEADAFAPQRTMPGQERMLGAMQDLVRRGRARGIGVTLVTQRAAVLSKDVLTQVEVLIALRTIAPQDREAIDAWIQAHDAHGQRKEFMESLASLPIGTAWFWSPGWLDVFKKVAIRERRTFDSSATPRVGQAAPAPKKLAPVDLETLKGQIAATIEKAKAEDPRELRRRIAELEREIRNKSAVSNSARPTASATADKALLRQQAAVIVMLRTAVEAAMKFVIQVSTQNFDVAGVDKAELEKAVYAAIGRAIQLVDARLDSRGRELTRLREQATRLIAALKAAAEAKDADISVLVEVTKNQPFTVAAPGPRRSPGASVRQSDLPKGEQLVLTAIAQHDAGVTREQLTVLTGYKRSTRDTYIQRLGERSFILVNGDLIRVDDAGLAALGPDFEPLPTGDALREHWLARLPEGERRVLEVLVAAYPKAVDREVISEKTDYARSSRDTYLQRLGARKLIISEGRGRVRAAEELFQ